MLTTVWVKAFSGGGGGCRELFQPNDFLQGRSASVFGFVNI